MANNAKVTAALDSVQDGDGNWTQFTVKDHGTAFDAANAAYFRMCSSADCGNAIITVNEVIE